ncbi:hypothetical protein JTE90_024667 [Oedothorax gibbosus]|uniref:Uncharacterized protein n=1 Tax=Oedothorax gibbosus TaxID=931172 RepID=A0AAV6TLU1_9ARAC|nr:hypothetical protein JTE90_024667 [Oedothorax gibbosus]
MSVFFNSEPVFFSSEEELFDLELSSESNDDHEQFLEVAAACLEVREHRFWTAEFLGKRDSMGNFNLFHELDDERFRNYFRMTRPQLESILAVSLTGRNTNCRDCRPVNMKLAVCLRYLATGDSVTGIEYSYRLGDSTIAKIVESVSAAMWLHLQPICQHLQQIAGRHLARNLESGGSFPIALGQLTGNTSPSKPLLILARSSTIIRSIFRRC